MDQFPALRRGQILLALHPHPTLHGRLLEFAARLALAAGQHNSGSLLVLDGGNCFNVYPVARCLRQHTAQVTPLLERIQVARAFTCFEMASLLRRTANTIQDQPACAGILVLDLLGNFRDENTPLPARRRLLGDCLPELRRLAQAAPLLVASRPADPTLTLALLEAADQVFDFTPPEPPPVQLSLPL